MDAAKAADYHASPFNASVAVPGVERISVDKMGIGKDRNADSVARVPEPKVVTAASVHGSSASRHYPPALSTFTRAAIFAASFIISSVIFAAVAVGLTSGANTPAQVQHAQSHEPAE